MTPICSRRERFMRNEGNVAGGGLWVIGYKGGGLHSHTLTWFRCIKLAPYKMFAKGKICSSVGIHHFYLIPRTFSYQQFPQIVWLPQTPHYALDWDLNLEHDHAPFQFKCMRSYFSGPEVLL